MIVDCRAAMCRAKEEAKQECDALYPPDSDYWQRIRKAEELRITLRKFHEMTTPPR